MSRRINWSKDGTRLLRGHTSGWTAEHTQASMDIFDEEPGIASSYNIGTSVGAPGLGNYIIFNFPSPVTIDRILMILFYRRSYIKIEVSSDTETSANPGITGTWDEVMPATLPNNLGNWYPFNDWSITPIETQWLRLTATSDYFDHYMDVAALHLFGSYTSPQIDLYDTQTTPAKITTDTYFDWIAAPSNEDYNQTKSFHIKNNDTISHTYNVTVSSQIIAGDDFITTNSNFEVSDDAGITRGLTLVTDPVLAGDLSNQIDVYSIISSANNDGSGWHHLKVEVSEV